MMQRSKGHLEFIGENEFYRIDGQLFRAEIMQPVGDDGRQVGQFVTAGNGIEFALRMARLQAGQTENLTKR